ncbi:MAG: hypothetical protein A3C70_00490 [Candidatus Zambryskibacteria bacterium RIFCSPHIGHO2_02_FULL_43_14]|uniref:Uncharacterized protein n=1 Tax=Candidatus Zambryskibacteria bacterium RIFCSPHIGHO2_02_FULL_43_14 TaxID=1802748 RepID=A0A1G2THQ1_9BACT|nr:MAG: hypothetical protein A2829_02065 [Candidatus Zambryskibacteria bacterium RIFCSPHIGHO2_01_FULL_43_60]OHA96817.1 MAG: hypothetical protein A3C70_00490 [Candidatus Zambryskibacteria bacterium RIFCSPHIGHO2_02_FULL_43_14]
MAKFQAIKEMLYSYKNIVDMFKKLLIKTKRRYAVLTTLALFMIVIWFNIFGFQSQTVIVKAERGTVEEEVLVTGKTRSRQEVDLGFEVGGKISTLNVQIGSPVISGDTLIKLDQSSFRASLRKAEAKLTEALVELESAQGEIENAYQTHSTNVKNAYTKADDAVRNDVDQFFTNSRTSQAMFNPSIEDSGLTYSGGISQTTKSELSWKRVEIEKLLTEWELSQKNLGKGENLSDAYQLAQNNLHTVRDFLDDVALAINSLGSIGFQYDATIQGYKNTVSEARNKVNMALSDMIVSRDKLGSAPKTTSETEYNKVLIEEARVESLRADVSSIEADLAKTVIHSPISGIVTKLEVEKGEIVNSGAILISVISEKELQVEANVSEINIGKLAVGNQVIITLDAFPSETYDGEIFYIDPGETIIDRVPTYKISVKFNDPTKPELRSGLTANLSIVTRKVEEVIKVPLYVVEKQGDKHFVKIKIGNGDNIEKKEIIVGLQGKDGSIEVISGLSEGEEIIADL